MPILEMHIVEGRTVEMKRKAIAAITAAIVESMQVRPDQVRILITEHPLDHFAVGGVTAAEKQNGNGQ